MIDMERGREGMTEEEFAKFAATEFEPWPVAQRQENNDTIEQFIHDSMPTVRLSLVFMTKTKDELAAAAQALGDDIEQCLDYMTEAADGFERIAETMRSAIFRQMVGMSVAGINEKNAE